MSNLLLTSAKQTNNVPSSLKNSSIAEWLEEEDFNSLDASKSKGKGVELLKTTSTKNKGPFGHLGVKPRSIAEEKMIKESMHTKAKI